MCIIWGTTTVLSLCEKVGKHAELYAQRNLKKGEISAEQAETITNEIEN